eukprot:g2514.t1
MASNGTSNATDVFVPCNQRPDFAAQLVCVDKLWLILRLSASSASEEPYSFCGGFRHQLAVADNKAYAVSLSGYFLATGLVLWSSFSDLQVLTASSNDTAAAAEVMGRNIGNVCGWQAIGIVFLEIARIFNDFMLMRGMNNGVEVVHKKNLAVACAEFGTYTSTGMVVMASISGQDTFFARDLVSSLIWFFCGQL